MASTSQELWVQVEDSNTMREGRESIYPDAAQKNLDSIDPTFEMESSRGTNEDSWHILNQNYRVDDTSVLVCFCHVRFGA